MHNLAILLDVLPKNKIGGSVIFTMTSLAFSLKPKGYFETKVLSPCVNDYENILMRFDGS